MNRISTLFFVVDNTQKDLSIECYSEDEIEKMDEELSRIFPKIEISPSENSISVLLEEIYKK